MERYLFFLKVLELYNKETDEGKKKEIAYDLEMIKIGLMPLKYGGYYERNNN